MKILEVDNLRVRFPVVGGVFARKIAEVKAVDGVSLQLEQGETLGLVGESGCGKTTVGRAIVNILADDGLRRGSLQRKIILYRHAVRLRRSGAAQPRKKMRAYRSDVQMIFQDPYSSLNPRMTVAQIVEEPLKIHMRLTARQRKERTGWLLGKVGLSREQANRYPHEFSGGQRQRIGIARALATNPKIVIADEPVSALDVSIQAQVVNLMQDLQDEFGLSYVFIAHDLSVVRHISNRIAVMYLGHIVEIGPGELIYKNPMHPYSRASAVGSSPPPDPESAHDRRIRLAGDVPNPHSTSLPAAHFGRGAPSRNLPARMRCLHWSSKRAGGSPAPGCEVGDAVRDGEVVLYG